MPTKDETSEATPKEGLLSRLLLIFGILLLVMAVAIAGYIIWQYADAQSRNNQIYSVAGLTMSSNEPVDIDTTLEDLQFDWDALRAINPDVVGWIIIPGTNVNYPVVQGADNEHYLYHLFDDSSSGTGAIFVDYKGSPTLTGQNNIIYGHNILDGTMFSDITLYANQDYFDRHRVVLLYTPALNFELSAVASINISEDNPLRQFYFEGEGELAAFASKTIGSPTTAAPGYFDSIKEAESLYFLVTCETINWSMRSVLCCVPVRVEIPLNASKE